MTGGKVLGGEIFDLTAKRRIAARAAKEGRDGDGIGKGRLGGGKRIHRVVGACDLKAHHRRRIAEELFKQRVGSAAAKRGTDEQISAAGEGARFQRIAGKIGVGICRELASRTHVDEHSLSLAAEGTEEGGLVVTDGGGNGDLTFIFTDEHALRKRGEHRRIDADRQKRGLVKRALFHVKESEGRGVRGIGQGTGE